MLEYPVDGVDVEQPLADGRGVNFVGDVGSVNNNAPTRGTRPAISATATITIAEIRALTINMGNYSCPCASSAKSPEYGVPSMTPAIVPAYS